jgi:hypothetical protein
MARVLKTYAGLDRSIYFLFLAQVVNSIGHFVHPFLVVLIALFIRESAPNREQIEASFAPDSSPQRAEKGSLAAVLLRRPVLLAFQFIHVLTVITLTTLVLHLTGRLAPALTVALSGLFFAAGFGLIGLVHSLPWLLLSTLIWTWTFSLSLAGAALLALLYWREPVAEGALRRSPEHRPR